MKAPIKRRITSYDVAQLAGVSRTTVSFVLNNVEGINISEGTRQRVLDAAQQLNYYPDASARTLVSGKSHTLGLVIRQDTEQVFVDAFLPQVVLGLSQACSERGFQILINPLAPLERGGYARLIHEKHVDGIVLSGPRSDDSELLHLVQENVPLVLMGQLPGTTIPFVDINAEDGAKKAVQHLISLGHRRIGIITNAPFEYTSAQQRHSGYQQALREANLPYDDDLVRTGAYTPASGRVAMHSLLRISNPPTAVFVASDVVCMGAMQAIRRAGLRIPEDISLVGFDDIALAAYFEPPLTTLRLPAYQLGWTAGRKLADIIEDRAENSATMLDTDLILRESTCPLG